MLAGNSLGKEFVVTTFGESHGKIVGVLIDGCPAGLSISEEDFQEELDQRIPAQPKIVSARIEKDTAKILSGVFNGKTTGAPIAITVDNKEIMSIDYDKIRDLPRPGHCDYPACVRYGGFNDYRGGGRFSGRVTVALVMAGVIAKKLLNRYNIDVLAYTVSIGKVKSEKKFSSAVEIRKNRSIAATRCPDLVCAEKMEEAIVAAKNMGDSIGGIVECVAFNVPAGVGEPLFDALDADLAKALFGVSAVKGVEFGTGFAAVEMFGSQNNDEFTVKDGKVETVTNNAGGIFGGISSGMPITMRVAIKPTPSISREQKTINLLTMENVTLNVNGRHDPCVVPKAVPAIEAVAAVTLVDHLIRAGHITRVFFEDKNNNSKKERL
ncbi:MAG: chorismate synthase [Candidatus Bathyarchaeota archaeon]|nr:chorismate synthase [Candidatus Termiticorpusculum sp.]MCL2867889.1 chorismate synthase [Candidatus Termiticorpusculum sp.]